MNDAEAWVFLKGAFEGYLAIVGAVTIIWWSFIILFIVFAPFLLRFYFWIKY